MFCSFCGAPIPRPEKTEKSVSVVSGQAEYAANGRGTVKEASISAEPLKKKKKTVLWIVPGVVILAVIVLAVLYFTGKIELPFGKTGKTDPSSGKTGRDTRNFAVNGYVLAGDDQYKYEYNEKGLCISARSDDGEEIAFSYDYDDHDRPITRYIKTGSGKSVYEKYKYDDKGWLKRLEIYEDGELKTVWRYDENGRAVSCEGIGVTEPNTPGFPLSAAEDIKWDDEGRLLSISFPVKRPLDAFVYYYAGVDASESKKEQYRKTLSDFISSNGIKADKDGMYLDELIIEKYQYDDQGRLIKYTITDEHSQLSRFVNTRGAKTSEYRTVNEIEFSYNRSSIDLVITMTNHEGGEAAKEILHTDYKYDISYGPDSLPVSAGPEKRPVSIDIYDKLDCRIDSAEIGLFGVFWREGMTNYLGELHGGFAGSDLYNAPSTLQIGGYQQLHVLGTGANGEKIEYYLWPDTLGRQRCQKFTDGLYTMPASIEMDVQKKSLYVMNEDRDVFVYRRLGS